MGLSRLLGGWLPVVLWLLLWELVSWQVGTARGSGKLRRARFVLGEALLLTLFGSLWFGSLGAGGWWLVFGLVGALREWPTSGGPPPERSGTLALGVSVLRLFRTVAAGGLLAWRLAPA
jgi:hypothetical protein